MMSFNRLIKIFFFLTATTVQSLGCCASPSVEALSAPYIYHSVNVIKGTYVESETDLSLGGSSSIRLRRCYQSQVAAEPDSPSGWLTSLPALIIKLPDGEIPLPNPSIQYEYDKKQRLVEVRSIDKKGRKANRWIKFSYQEDEEGRNVSCEALADDKTTLRYSYTIDPINHRLPGLFLHKVEKNGFPLLSYDYQKHPLTHSLLLTRRDEGGGRYMIADYYDRRANDVGGTQVELGDIVVDPRWGRVKTLKGPVGTDGTPLITHRFFYGDGHTEVRDALDHKIIYRYADFERLTAIEYYDDQENLYRTERYEWKVDPRFAEPLMMGRRFEDSQGKLVKGYSFEYDEWGNLTKETFSGILTGTKDTPENYEVRYSYKDGLLAAKEEGDAICTTYAYDEMNRPVAEHQKIDGFYHLRTFYFYDENDVVVKKIIDDGCGESADDLSGVLHRAITKIKPSTANASLGLPEVVEEFYWDPDCGTEKLLNKTVNGYSDEGRLISRQRFDAAGFCIEDTVHSYDVFGQPTGEVGGDGAFSHAEYDQNGNNVFQFAQNSDGSCGSKWQQFDFSNRLIRKEESNSQGESSIVHYKYDLAGNKIAESDEGGNETRYEYDAFGRLISIEQPPCLDGEGQVVNPITTFEYDLCNNISKTTDPNGWTTTAIYNVRGKPLRIDYPDGTHETFTYNLAGMLLTERSRTGIVTHYTRDGLGRCLKTVIEDEQGHALSETTAGYSTFGLVAQTDALGNRKVIRYDAAGRQKELLEQTPEGLRQTLFIYDERGRLAEKRMLLANGYVSHIYEYESGKDPVAVKVVDEKGNEIQRMPLDDTQGKECSKNVEWESNTLGQIVKAVEELDEEGNLTKTVYDPAGRVSLVSRTDALNIPMRRIEHRYDAAGNKVKEIHEDCRNGSLFILSWKYGCGNRVEAYIEGEGQDGQRLTTLEYNDKGQISCRIKPDGTKLLISYNPSGQVEEINSSDGSVSYRYTCDALGNVLSATDLNSGKETVRDYTSFSQIAQERLANGLTLTFSYDSLGQRTQTTLPDGSSIDYRYQGTLLKGVSRSDATGLLLYAHIYDAYEEGRIKSASLIGNAGKIHCSYGLDGNLEQLKTPYWSEQACYDGKGRVISSTITDTAGDSTQEYFYGPDSELVGIKGAGEEAYSYDALGNRTDDDVDPLNQLMQRNGEVFAYDANGNMVSHQGNGINLQFSYDALNRLVSVTDPLKTETRYLYDGFNRRISKTTFLWDSRSSKWMETGQELYLYTGLCEIGSVQTDGRITELRVLGAGFGAEIGAAVAIELDGNVYAPIHDRRGNVAALVSAGDRDVVECYRYTAFGCMQVYDSEGNELDASQVGMPWGFSSKRIDPETGWVFYGRRYYDPQAGRWTTPDPLEHLDGPNRYAFVHNNPVMNCDLYGEMTFNEAWRSFCRLFNYGINLVQDSIHYYQQKVGYANYSRHEIEEFSNAVVGHLFLRLTGFYLHHPEVGVLGKGEINDKVRITMINGILNIRAEYMENVALFSRTHGGVNIHYIFRPSDGWAHDLMKSVLTKFGLMSSQAKLLAAKWRQLIREMGGVGNGGLIIHYAHSIGGSETNNAKRLLTLEERMMIKVFTIGSPTLIPEDAFQSVVNYVSWRDQVCYFDPIGYIRALLRLDTNTIFVGSPFGRPLFDHYLDGQTYSTVVTALGGEFVNTYGSL